MTNKGPICLLSLCALSLSGCFGGGSSSSSSSSSFTQSSSSSSSSSTESSSSSSSSSSFPSLPYNEEHNLFAYSFPGLGNDVMPIAAWDAPWAVGEYDYQTKEQYGYIKEAGLNTIYGLYETAGNTRPKVDKALSLSDEAGITYMVRNESLGVLAEDEASFKEEVDSFTSHKSFGGFLVADEPSANKFSSFVDARKLMRKYYSKYAYYLNTFPTYASSAQFSGSGTSEMTYDEYAESYLSTVEPQMFSYDFYGLPDKENIVDDGYYNQLYLARNAAQKHKIPFWPFIQAFGSSGWMRVPTEQDIYWQVGSSLVYGAKAIQYFCYMTPYEMPNWRGSFIDFNGKKTSIFPYFQKANAFVSKVDSILMKSTQVAMMAFGESPSPLPEAQKSEFVTSFREVKEVKTSSDVLISLFDHGGKTAIYILNNSLTKDASLALDFTSPVKADVYSFDSSKAEEGSSLSFDIKKGESVLVDLTNYK